MKDNIKRFIGSGLQGLVRSYGQSRLAVGLCAGLFAAGLAVAQPVNDNFVNATVISGLTGSTAGNNGGATQQAGEPSPVITDDNGPVDVTNSVWFEWTAPQSGNVTFDTIGSVGVNFQPMDTVLAVWTGTSLGGLFLTTADDNQFAGTPTNSSTTFTAVGGITYYLAIYVDADALGVPGNYVLNWKEQGAPNSGSFAFTAANYNYSRTESTAPRGKFMRARPARATVTRTGGADGATEVGYQLTETVFTNGITTNIYIIENDSTTTDSNGVVLGITNVTTTLYNITNYYQNYNSSQPGGYYTRVYLTADLFTVTNVNGFPYPPVVSNNIPYVTNFPVVVGPNPSFLVSTDAASGDITYSTNTITFSNAAIVTYITSYTGTNINATNLASALTNGMLNFGAGQLVFPDFEMNQDLYLAPGAALPNLVNNLLSITLTGAVLDPLEDPTVLPPPTLGMTTNTLMTFLNPNSGDLFKGPFAADGSTNFMYGIQANINSIFNFERATLACDKFVNGTLIANVLVTLNSPPGATSKTVYYRTDHLTKDDDNNQFQTQAGSDYARPDNATQFAATSDFTSQLSSVTFPANMQPPYQELIQIPITQDSMVKFDRDLQLELYYPPGVQVDGYIGNISTLDLTILFTTAPAGAVDCFYNPENNYQTSPALNPLPGANGEVDAVFIQTNDNKTVIGGNFTAYNNVSGAARNYIARVNTDGSLDTTFNPGSGFDASVAGVTEDAAGNVIAVGYFHSINGSLRNGVARLTPNGSLDGSFNPGYGANGPVLATAIQPDGKILIAGSFTSYNNTNASHIARLNVDGSLDTTFNLGTGLNDDVYSISVSPTGVIYIGGAFTNVSGANISYLASLNSDGSLNTGFNVGTGADTPINVVLVQPDGQVLIGGDFTEIGGLAVGPGIARLGTNGQADVNFNIGTGPDDVVYTLALQSDTKILVGGLFKSINQTRRVSIARLLPNGWVDTTFLDTAYNQYAGLPNFYYNPNVTPPNPVYALGEQSDGGVIIGGLFQSVGGDGFSGSAGPGTYGNVRNNMHARNNLARLVGGITPGPGNIGLSYSSYSANVSSPSFFVNLVRSNGFLGTVSATFDTVPLGTGPGYAAYGVDYTLGSSIATWGTSWASTWMMADGLTGPNNQEVAVDGTLYYGFNTVTVNIISNSNANTTLDIGMTQPQIMDTFHLGGENIPLGVALGNSLAPLTIIHNNINPGIFNLSQSYYTVLENAGNATFTVTRTSGTDNRVTVNYSTANGTALNGTDYTTKTGTLTFNAGVASQTFTVPIIAGTIARPDRIFTVKISTPSGGAALGTVTNAQVEIINNNITTGFAEFVNGIPASATIMGYGTNENSGSAQVSIARLGGSAGTLTVTVATADASAHNGVNYTGNTTNLLWNSGDATLRTLSIPVLDDNAVTTNLSFTVSLSNPAINGLSTSNLLGLYSNAVVTVTNVDSPGTAEFTTPSFVVNENAGYAIIPVIRTGGSSGTLTVSYSNMDGTATAAANYGAVSGTFNFAPGQVGTNFIVAITNLNSQWVSPLNFYLVLNNANPTNGLGTPNICQVNINGSQAYNNPPGQADGNFNGTFNGPVSSLALQSDGKLLAGGSFTMADGISRQRVARLKTDGTLDTTFSTSLPTSGASDTVRSVLYESSGLIVVGGFFTNFNNTVLNHIARMNVNGSLDSSFVPGAGTDNPIYAMAQNFVGGQRRIVVGGSFTIYNGTSRNGIAQLLDNGTLDTSFNPGLGANATVYAVAAQPDGKVLIGGDFTSVNGVACNYLARLNLDGSVDRTFNPGTGAGASVRALAVQGDGRILVGGLFTTFNGSNALHLARLNANGSVDASFVPPAGANGNVYTIALQPDTRIVVGGDFTQFNGVTRNRITRLNPDGTTDTSINFGYGADGTVLAAVIQSDAKIDLGGSFANYNNQPHANIVRINGGSESGSGTFLFSSSTYSVDERGSNVLVTVIRTGGTSGTNASGLGDILIPFATADGTALADTDHGAVTNYYGVITNLDFPPGEVIKTVSITVQDDNLITPALTVNLLITNVPASLLGNQSTAVLSIINDDSAIDFVSTSYSAPKNVINGVAVVNVQRLGSISGTSTVTFITTTNGTAQPGTDYTPVGPVPVTFAPGVSNVAVNIPLNNNGLAEGNLTVGMQLSGASGSTLINPTNAVLTIVDTVNAPGLLSFSATNYFITEAGTTGYTNATITVVRTLGSVGVVNVNYYTTPGTATPGIKYTPVVGSLTFGDGEVSKAFIVPVVNSGSAEGPEYLNLALTNVSGGASLTTPTNATLTILNTNAGVAFASATSSFPENGGILFGGNPDTVFVNVLRLNYTNSTVMVKYATTDGTAQSNLNYTVTAGTLTFAPGVTTLAVPVQLLHDTNVTGTLNFSLTLSSPSGAQLAAPSTTVIQELDAETGLSFLAPSNTVLKTVGTLFLPVFNSNPSLGPVSVSYATGGGTATAGVDYSAANGVLTFTNGQSLNFIPVAILPNGILQSNQTFNVTLFNPLAPGVLVPPSMETITIIETNTPPGASLSSPVLVNGDSGTVSLDTSNSLALTGSPIAWFAWTATNSGDVEFDTIGSVDDFFGANLITELYVFTGNNQSTLNQVVANAGISPVGQQNIWGYNLYNLGGFNSGFGFGQGLGLGNIPEILSSETLYLQPYAGPSEVHFNAVAGTTYKIAILSSPTGVVKLNWGFHPSGAFRFATEELDPTGLTYSNGTQMLLYRVAETEGTRGLFATTINSGSGVGRLEGTYAVNLMDSTIYGTTYLNGGRSGYVFDVPGLLVSVTRVAGSSGRVQVNYTTADIPTNSYLMGQNGFLLNGDLPASSIGKNTLTTNVFQFGSILITNTSITTIAPDYTPVSGTLTFDDSEMTKTIFIPVTDDGGAPRQNRDFSILLTNAVLDANESTDVEKPRLDNLFNVAVVRILDADISPQGGSQSDQIVTNISLDPISFASVTNTITNTVYATQPTNQVFNFEKAHYRVTRDSSDYWGSNYIVTVYVNRNGTNASGSQTIHWRVNNYYLDNAGGDLQNGEFPLQPGSDYATPTPPNNVGYLGLVPDFDLPNNNYSGTITFPGGNGAFNPQPISFNIHNNGLQQFNEDFTVSLYYENSQGATFPVGMIDQTTVTILFDDNHPPAGSVDEFYNSDFSQNMAGPIPTVPQEMTHPGTDGEVLGLAVQPDNKTIVVGDFFSYDQTARNSIARANPDGSLDASFNPGSGPNNFVNCIALTTNYESFIGGAFSSFNGSLCDGIALITTNGTVDSSFNSGLGFNGTIYTLAFQTNGELLVGGDFTSYNGTARRYLALLQANGNLDSSFDPGTNLNSAVYAISAQPNGQLVVGGNFTAAGGISGQNYLARLNPDGTFDPTFDPGSGANAAVLALGTQPDGNIVVGGEFTIMNGASANRIARLTPSGFTDPLFFAGTGVDGPVYNLLVYTNAIFSTTNFANTNPIVAVQTNFTIYAGGAFTSVNGTHRLGFTRLNADGTVDTSFLDTAYNQFAGLPRDHFNDPLGTVLASGVQNDGNVMIGGSFNRVGGGQSDDVDVRPETVDTNNAAIIRGTATNTLSSVSLDFMSQVQKTRAGIRNRSNIARLIGGATPGPGNISLLYPSYSINKSQSPINVALIRANGTLGPASANFAVLPGLAQNGVDYSYIGVDPLYWTVWQTVNPSGRMHSDGYFGTNGFVQDEYNRFSSGFPSLSSLSVNILDNTNSLNNLSAQFQLANPVQDLFYLGGEDVPLGVALGQSVAPFTLIDDHHFSGNFAFTSANYVGNGLSASIGIQRTNGNYGVVSLKYATTTNGSTALLNNDYLASSGTLTFQPSDTNHTFNVVILNTNSVSAVEKTVNLTLFGLNPPVNGLASLGQTNAVLHIINPNFQGFLNLSSNLYSANLSAGFVAITVNRTVGSKGTLTVQCASANGTAVSGTDYIGFTNTLQWNSGDVMPKIITVPLLNHGTVNGGRQFAVSIYNPALNSISTPSLFPPNGPTNAIILINNDNSYGTFQFSSPSYVVNESGGYSVLTVIRNGGTNGTATVNFTNFNVTAFAGTNYVATNGTLTFLPGQLAATIQVPILNDGVADPAPGSFYFTTVLSTPSAGASLGAPVSANTYIVDAFSFNRPPGAPDTAFNPGSGMNSDVYALGLQSDGQIIAGGNFTAVDGVPESYLARLNTDGTLDRSGFLYGLAGASSPVYALAVQTDDNIVVGGTFTNINGTILNHIARLNGLDGTLDTSFNPGAGADNAVYSLAETFVGGSRFIYVGGAFGYISGSSSPFIGRLQNNGVLDSSFKTGSGPNATVYAVVPYPTNSFFAGKVLIGGAFTNVNNNTAGRIARLNIDGSVDTNFTANVSLGAADTVRTIAIQTDGRILIGGDFTNFDGVALNHLARLNSDGTLDATFTGNLGVGANATVSAVALQADNRIVVAGQFTQANGVTRNRITRLLSTGAVDPTINFGDGANGAVNAVVIQPADQLIVIGGSFTLYDDLVADHVARIYGGSITGSGLFQFTSASYSIDEDGLQAIVGVKRVGGTSGPNPGGTGTVAVNFATLAAGSTAVAGVNYSNVNVQLNYPAGEVLQYVTIPVMDDSNITPNLTVNLQVSAPTPPAGLGDQSTAVLNIINDDSGVAFGSVAYTVPKNILTGYGAVHVLRLGSASGTCSVDVFTSTNGTAVTNLDYYPTNVLLTFNPGQTDVVVQVPVINNALVEGSRTVGLGMSNLVNVLQTSPSNTTLTIIDTVTAPGQLSFSSPTYTAISSSGFATLNVVRSGGSSGSVSVGYNTVPGTATPGINYTTSSGTVSFNDGQTNAAFSIPLLPNNLAIGPVTLSVLLSNPSGGATLISPTNATLTIVNTNVVIVFAAATNTFSETAGVVPINVTRYNNTTVSSTVSYKTTDGTALSNLNYSATASSLTFSPGQSSRTVLVTLLHDTNYTGTVSFNMNLYNPGVGVQIGSPNPTVVQETDAEAGISFTNAALTTSKNVGTFFINVVCANTNVEPVLINSNSVPLSVNYYTMDGTGQNGTDYSAVSGTLTFTNGNAVDTIGVPITLNGLVSGNKTFSVILTNPTAPGVLVAPSTTVVTIVDNNTGLSFSSPTYTVNKSAGLATITVVRTDNTNLISSVNFIATNGTAMNGLNFTATNGTLVFSNGITSGSFVVPVSDTTAAMPDLTVLLQLSGAVNGSLTPPSAATLIIHDDSGSYVVPAGSLLVSNSNGADSTNDLIGPNDAVTLQFAFRDAGGSNVLNLIAQPVASASVLSPSPAQASYGPLAYLGHSVSQPFSFVAHGTNNQPVNVMFNLYDSSLANPIGTAVFGYILGTQTTSLSNSATIIINDNTSASPYPSTINVKGLVGSVVKATVTLNRFYHTSPSDVDALVQSPSGPNTLIMAHVGGQTMVTNVVLTFDDAATNSMTHGGSAVTSTNKPSAILPVRNFP